MSQTDPSREFQDGLQSTVPANAVVLWNQSPSPSKLKQNDFYKRYALGAPPSYLESYESGIRLADLFKEELGTWCETSGFNTNVFDLNLNCTIHARMEDADYPNIVFEVSAKALVA
jgi:hypothetical protein